MKRWIWIASLCLWMVSCSGSSDLMFHDEEGLIDDSLFYMEGEGEPVRVSFEMSEVRVSGQIREIRFLDDAEKNLGSTTGSMSFSPDEACVAIIPMPNGFTTLDIDFGRLDFRPGGGDGEGSLSSLLLPHFVIIRDGGRWENVTIRFNMKDDQLAETSEDRRALLKDLLNGLEVLEDSKVVGYGDYEKTMALLSPEDSLVIGIEEIEYLSDGEFPTLFDPKGGIMWTGDLGILSWEEQLGVCERYGMHLATFLDWAYFWGVEDATERSIPILSYNWYWVTKDTKYDSVSGLFHHDDSIGPDGNILCVGYDMDSPFQEGFSPAELGLLWEETGESLSYEEAKNYCETTTIQGIDGWRLPGVREAAFVNLSKEGMEDSHWTEERFSVAQEKAWAWLGKVWEPLETQEKLSVSCVRSLP